MEKILDPGQAALSLTAGSLSHSEKVIGGKLTPIAPVGMPSPFSRSGPGFGESIKPDFVEYGGNYVVDNETERVSTNGETNVLMASGKLTGVLAHNVGTSFAAPRIAHHLAIILSELRELGLNPSSSLLRSIMANSAIPEEANHEIAKRDYLNTVGFGIPNFNRALSCEKHSIVLYWDGSIKPYHTAIFRIYVPEELEQIKRTQKFFHVSAAFAPPVQKWGVSNYLGVTSEFRMFRGDKDLDAIDAMLQREDEEKNVPADKVDELTSKLGIKARSTGCLQSDRFVWSDHKEDYSENEYTLAISMSKCSKWLKDENIEIPVSVVVRFEESSGQFKELYAKVKSRVRAKAPS